MQPPIDVVKAFNDDNININSIREMRNVEKEVRIYPNPTKGPVQVYVAGSDTEVQISLLSVLGKTILNESRRVSASRAIDLDLSNSKSGVYILTVEGETVRMSSKIIRN